MNSIKKTAICFAVLGGITLGAFAAMASVEQARDFIQELGNKVIGIVADNSGNAATKERQLNALFIEAVDTDWIAKFVIGRYWRESTDEQKHQYLEVYKKFLVGSYVSKFTKYTDQKMVIDRFTAESDGEYIVETSINDQDGKTYRVSYKVRQGSDGKLSIYDIIAEGISMITTQRSEFGSILAREGIAVLIEKLEQRI